MKEFREQIEKRAQEKTIEQIYKDVFELLKAFTGKKSQADVNFEFEKTFCEKRKIFSSSILEF